MVHHVAVILLELLGYASMTIAQPSSEALLFECEMKLARDRYAESSPYNGYLQSAREKMISESVTAWDRWKTNRETQVPRESNVFFKHTSIFTVPNPQNQNECASVIHYRVGCRFSKSCINSAQCKECIEKLSRQLIDQLCYLMKQGSGYANDCFVRYADMYLGKDLPSWPFFSRF